jgi:hypothetical protein
VTWYERRAIVLKMAETEPGWGCVRLVHERHIGRVQMVRKYGQRAGFHPVGSSGYAALAISTAQRQKSITMRLPK